jgi:hypothetical protein
MSKGLARRVNAGWPGSVAGDSGVPDRLRRPGFFVVHAGVLVRRDRRCARAGCRGEHARWAGCSQWASCAHKLTAARLGRSPQTHLHAGGAARCQVRGPAARRSLADALPGGERGAGAPRAARGHPAPCIGKRAAAARLLAVSPSQHTHQAPRSPAAAGLGSGALAPRSRGTSRLPSTAWRGGRPRGPPLRRPSSLPQACTCLFLLRSGSGGVACLACGPFRCPCLSGPSVSSPAHCARWARRLGSGRGGCRACGLLSARGQAGRAEGPAGQVG